MKVLIFSSFFTPAFKAGGPARSLTNLSRELALKHDVVVVTSDRDLGDDVPFSELESPAEVSGALVHYVNVASWHRLFQELRNVSKIPYDVVILNSIWSIRLSFVPALLVLARQIRADTVILMPRGEIESGALALKAKKKQLAARLVKGVYSHAADVAAGTSPSELTNIRSWFPRMPRVLVSNIPDELASGYIRGGGTTLRLLYLGRIHPTKGLLELLPALGLLDFDVRLTVAGPVGDSEYFQRCLEVSSRLPESIQVDWIGPVDRHRIEALLWSSDLMVTLTMGENFGHTIAESLQASCPVMATDTTPWTDILLDGAGYICTDREDAGSVASTLTRAHHDLERDTPGARGRARHGFEKWRSGQPFDVVEQSLALLRR